MAKDVLITPASGSIEIKNDTDTLKVKIVAENITTSDKVLTLPNKTGTLAITTDVPNITGGASTIVSSDLTKSRALISNTDGKVDVSTTTSTQLGFLSGASSNIQTQLNGKVPYNDALMPRNSFGGRKLFTSHLDNAFFLLDERYTIAAGFYNKTDDSLYSLATITTLFNSDYDGSVLIPLGTYLKLHISFAGSGYVYNGAECFPGFPYGKIYLSYYNTSWPASAKFRVYNNYEPHGLGWSDYVNFSDFVNNGSSNRIQVVTQGKYAISEMEIIVESPDTGLPTRLTQIDFSLDRPTTQEMPVVSKFINQKIYKDLDFVGVGKPKVAGQQVYHPGNKPTLAAIGAAASNHNHDTIYAPLTHNHIMGYYSTVNASDLNTTLGTGQFSWGNTSTNIPVAGSYGQGINIVSAGTAHNNSNNCITQLAFSTLNNAAYFRGKTNSGSWNSWHTFYHTGNKPTAVDVGLGSVDNTSDANKPVSTATQTALNLKANLASPELTGTPTAPTAATATNTTQIATTAFVKAQGYVTSSGVTSVSAGNGLNFTTITGTGSVTLGTPGTLTSATTNGVTATSHTHAITTYGLTGTSNQITVTGAGKILGAATTLSLPQNIHTGASPTFAGVNLGAGANTWTIDDTTTNVLTFKDSGNTRLEIKAGGLYVNGSSTPLGQGSVTSVSLASGTDNGTLKLTVNGTATDNIAVKGLGSAAYTPTSNYEPAISTKGTAFNKNFGSAAGTVTQGNDSRLSDARTPTAHVLNSASHTVSGLTTGHFLKATSATSFGFAAHGLTYSDVNAAPTAGSSSITTLGTIGAGKWQGSTISSTYGGTGVNNGGRTLAVNTNSGTLAFTNASTTLTVANNASISGTNTGDQTTITGNAGSATYASAVTTTAENTGTTPRYILFANSVSGNQVLKTDTGLTYHPTNNALTAAKFIGALTGNADTATKLANIATSFSGTYPLVVNVDGTLYSHSSATYTGSTATLRLPNLELGNGTPTWTISDTTSQLKFINGGTAILPKVSTGTKTIAFKEDVQYIPLLWDAGADIQSASVQHLLGLSTQGMGGASQVGAASVITDLIFAESGEFPVGTPMVYAARIMINESGYQLNFTNYSGSDLITVDVTAGQYVYVELTINSYTDATRTYNGTTKIELRNKTTGAVVNAYAHASKALMYIEATDMGVSFSTIKIRWNCYYKEI